MNVFIIGSPLQTAMALDKKRLNKQIVECRQILSALKGETTAWRNHPATLQYKGHERWLGNYLACLLRYRAGEIERAKTSDMVCKACTPEFHTLGYFQQMKRRLYTKNPEFYSDWAYLGTSEVNWYFVEGEWRYYVKGKRVNYLF